MRRLLILIALVLSGPLSWGIELSDLPRRDNLKIGIYIGTFDPPHAGHQKVAEAAIEQSGLDFVLFIPNDRAFHKPNAVPWVMRKQMSRILFTQSQSIIVPHFSAGSELSTVQDSIKYIRTQFSDAQLYGMIGTDIAAMAEQIFPTEKYWMAHMDGWLVNQREGYDARLIPASINMKPVQTFVAHDGGWSSTKIREMILKNDGGEALDKDVLGFINKNQLYRFNHSCAGVLLAL
jgi:nicotinate-nucleotide adenylyltransferase